MSISLWQIHYAIIADSFRNEQSGYMTILWFLKTIQGAVNDSFRLSDLPLDLLTNNAETICDSSSYMTNACNVYIVALHKMGDFQ